MVYTASSELTGLLGLNRLPGIEVGDISQTINAYTLSAVNTVSIQGFGSRTSVSAKAALEIQTPKRVQVGFTHHKCVKQTGFMLSYAHAPDLLFSCMYMLQADLHAMKVNAAFCLTAAEKHSVSLSVM